MTKAPRGIRNNNPGNIRHGEDWKGLAADQLDDEFCTFVDAQHGIRAMGRTLLTYERKHGINTVKKIINRWAPPVENDTGAYVKHVAQRVGVNADEVIRVADHLEDLVAVIIRHENGVNPYDPEVIMEGCQLARV